jgi:hypothetical protein
MTDTLSSPFPSFLIRISPSRRPDLMVGWSPKVPDDQVSPASTVWTAGRSHLTVTGQIIERSL